MSARRCFWGYVLVLMLGCLAARGQVIFVDGAATGANDGSSWEDAYTYLQSAINAGVAGDSVWVAKGTYKPTTSTVRSISFALKSDVAVYGGFAGDENPATFNLAARNFLTNETVLSGDIGTEGNNTDNSYRVVTGASGAAIDGFTITGGYAPGGWGAPSDGAGMYNSYCNPTVRNCVFRDNSASLSGGGIFNSHSDPAISSCTFEGNSAQSGGAMYNSYSGPTINSCTFRQNTATFFGGAMRNEPSCSPEILNCTFSENSSDFGAAISNSSSSVSASGCVFIQNAADYDGGAIFNDSSTSLEVNDCNFTFNTAGRNAGGIINGQNCTAMISGSVFNENSAVSLGGGILNGQSSYVTIAQSTFGGNSASSGGGMANDANTIVIDCSFNGNSADSSGGGIYNQGVQPIIRRCSFTQNSAGVAGGGMSSGQSCTTEIADCHFTGNTAVTWGGGMIIHGSDTISGCSFSGNSAPQGGGIYSDGEANISRCSFIGNNASTEGGGMYNSGFSRLMKCTFNGNFSVNGGGVYDAPSATGVISKCTFEANQSECGGGILNYNSSTLLSITGCEFVRNQATRSGGAIYNYESFSSIIGCVFNGNKAVNFGGGMLNWLNAPTICNCAFAGNSASKGGGLYNYECYVAYPGMVNCTLSCNVAEYGGGIYSDGGSLDINNGILWGNSASSGQGAQIYGSASSSYSDIEDDITTINVPPSFVEYPSPGGDGSWGTLDDDYGNLALSQSSPCIDAADNDAVPAGIFTDIADDLRFYDNPGVADTGNGAAPIVDMGAYEWQPYSAGNMGGDSIVNLYDFAFLAQRWLSSECTAPNWCDGTDFDHSGTIDLTDLRVIIYNWLE